MKMDSCDVLVVGGGPAGSTCAWKLCQAGLDVMVLDAAVFPRDKVCAGWVTPGVFRLLDLDPSEYRATGLTIQDITGFRTSVMSPIWSWTLTSTDSTGRCSPFPDFVPG